MGLTCRVRRRMGRRGSAIADGAESAHLLANGWHRGGADDIAPRAARRTPELGLSLLLAPRRHTHPPRFDERGLSRRGQSVARLAAARCGRTAVAAADYVWRRRRTAASRMGGHLAARV